MNITQIQDLIKFVAKSGVSEVEIEQKEFKITIRTEPYKSKRSQAAAQQHIIAQPVQQAIPVQQAGLVAAPVAAGAPAPAVKPVAEDNNYITIKAPMIGTFYRSSGPEKPPFVNVGDDIKVGQVICIIEAMKLFNEIESEVGGKIVKVLMDDTKPIEYDQPLFLVEPA